MDEYQRSIYVLRSCDKTRVKEEEAGVFLDISEDIQGQDRLTYKCNKCGEAHTSLRFG